MKPRFAGALLALPLTLGLALAGCGRSDDDGGTGVATAGGAAARPSASASGAAALGEEERQLRFAQCMRQNGVEVPDPEPGGQGTMLRFGADVDPQKVEAAMQKCRTLLPNGGELPKLDPAQIDTMRKLARCMRDNGVPDFPDPDANGMIKIDRGAMNPEDTKVRAAMEKCRQYAPDFGGHR
jgi:hypothetical protein